MEFADIPTEQTTAVTDAVFAVLAIAAAVYLHRISQKSRWKITLWVWSFVLLAIAAVLGTAVHGIKMSKVFQLFLWNPLYLTLGLLVGFFTVAVVYEKGARSAFDPRSKSTKY